MLGTKEHGVVQSPCMLLTAQGMAGTGWEWLCFQAASIVVQKKLKQPTNMALGGGGGGWCSVG
jgi:hypothetical protein